MQSHSKTVYSSNMKDLNPRRQNAFFKNPSAHLQELCWIMFLICFHHRPLILLPVPSKMLHFCCKKLTLYFPPSCCHSLQGHTHSHSSIRFNRTSLVWHGQMLRDAHDGKRRLSPVCKDKQKNEWMEWMDEKSNRSFQSIQSAEPRDSLQVKLWPESISYNYDYTS